MSEMVTEKAEYYVNTWVNGNKTHVIVTLARLLTSRSIGARIEYNHILEKFIEYDSNLALIVIHNVNHKIHG